MRLSLRVAKKLAKNGNLVGMGNCLKSRKSSPPNKVFTLAAFGLDNAGKTSVVKAIKGDPLSDVAPTVGFASNRFKHGSYDITMYDVGGGARIRGIWKNYFAEIHGLIYVVDSSDRNRTEENRVELSKLLSHPRIKGKPLLLLLNKHDIDGAMDENDATESLNLEPMVNANQCHCKVEMCSASKGVGKLADTNLRNGFDWLIGYIEKNYDTLAKKIEADVASQKAELEEEKQLRMERIKRAKAERGELDEDELPGQTKEKKMEQDGKLEEDSQGDDRMSPDRKQTEAYAFPMKANGFPDHLRQSLLDDSGRFDENAHLTGSTTVRPSVRGPENASLRNSFDNSNVPSLPPISPATGLRKQIVSPPSNVNRSNGVVVVSQRRTSVDSKLSDDSRLPAVHAHPVLNGHVVANQAHENPQSATSTAEDSTADVSENPRKRRRQKRLGRFNKTAPIASAAIQPPSESEDASHETPPSPLISRPFNNAEINFVKPLQEYVELPKINDNRTSVHRLSEDSAAPKSNWGLAEDL